MQDVVRAHHQHARFELPLPGDNGTWTASGRREVGVEGRANQL